MSLFNEQMQEQLKQHLDVSGITGTVRNRYTFRKREKKNLRRWKRDQIRNAVHSAQTVGILPTGLIWWLIRLAVEAFLRRYLFEDAK